MEISGDKTKELEDSLDATSTDDEYETSDESEKSLVINEAEDPLEGKTDCDKDKLPQNEIAEAKMNEGEKVKETEKQNSPGGKQIAKVKHLNVMYSPHRRILRAYRRRAAMRYSPKKKFPSQEQTQVIAVETSSSPEAEKEKPKFSPSNYPSSFTQGMVTVRKLETLLEPKRNEPSTSSTLNVLANDQSGTRIMFYPPGVNSRPITISKVSIKVAPGGNSAKKVPFLPKILRPKLRKIKPFYKSKPAEAKRSPPPKILHSSPTGNRIRLQKLSDGTYGLQRNNVQPRTFQSAYMESKIMNHITQAQKSVPNNGLKNLPVATSNSAAISVTPPSHTYKVPQKNMILEKIESLHQKNSTKEDQMTAVELPTVQEKPETFKYLIPQNMLASATDKIKPLNPTPTQLRSLLVQPTALKSQNNRADLFVVDNDSDGEKKESESSSNNERSRRKSTLVPKKDNIDCQFEESPVKVLPRPQANMDLIENLTNYRVMVSKLMKKLNIPDFDFSNEDSDNYINLYKIYRK